MTHHAVVDQIDPNPLTLDEGDRVMHIRHLLAVERPHEPLHVAGEMDIETAVRSTHVRIALQRHEILVDRKSNTSELQSLMRISYAVFCLKKKQHNNSTEH